MKQVETKLASQQVKIELEKVLDHYKIDKANFIFVDSLNEKVSLSLLHKTSLSLDKVKKYTRDKYKKSNKIKEEKIKTMGDNEEGIALLQDKYYNNAVVNIVTGKYETDQFKEFSNGVTRKKDPIYAYPINTHGRAHFFAPVKKIGTLHVDSFWFNLAVIWLISVILYILLLFDVFRKIINSINQLKYRYMFMQ